MHGSVIGWRFERATVDKISGGRRREFVLAGSGDFAQ